MSGLDVVRLDEILVGRYDETVRAGEERPARFLRCRIGCTECCIGVFDITALDAERLRRGLRELTRENPEQAEGIRERALSQWRDISPRFPGDALSATLDDHDDARDRLGAELGHLPCPVLDPVTGACLLYPYRPLTCRSYGLPVRFGAETLPPCTLNFEGASDEEVARANIEPDVEDLEGELLAALPASGDTVLSAAIALGEPSRQRDL